MKNAKKAFASALCGMALVGAGCGAAVDTNINSNVNANANVNVNKPVVKPVEKKVRQLEIDIAAQNSSGMSGKAVLLEVDSQTKVMINVAGETTATRRPAHIHVGACPTPGAVKWGLTEVVQGKSVTTIDATFDEVAAALDAGLALNIHESAENMGKYLACGNLLRARIMDKVPGIEAVMSATATTGATVNTNGANANVNANMNANTNGNVNY